MTGGRRTGRPTLPDTALLERLADAVIDDPDTKVAPFVRRLLAAAPGAIAVHSADAVVRRIQHKWRLEGARLLARRRRRLAGCRRIVDRPIGQQAHRMIERIVEPFEQRVITQYLLDLLVQFERRQLQQPD